MIQDLKTHELKMCGNCFHLLWWEEVQKPHNCACVFVSPPLSLSHTHTLYTVCNAITILIPNNVAQCVGSVVDKKIWFSHSNWHITGPCIHKQSENALTKAKISVVPCLIYTIRVDIHTFARANRISVHNEGSFHQNQRHNGRFSLRQKPEESGFLWHLHIPPTLPSRWELPCLWLMAAVTNLVMCFCSTLIPNVVDDLEVPQVFTFFRKAAVLYCNLAKKVLSLK